MTITMPNDKPQKAKRFWTTTSLRQEHDGFAVTLDGRDVKTPAGSVFRAPNQQLGEAICAEWDGQVEVIDPELMPLFKFTVTAIDRVTPQRSAIVQELANYGANDLLCYREADDPRLSAHQHQIWHPYLDWMADQHGIALTVFKGIMPGDQPEQIKDHLHNLVDVYDDFTLAGLYTLVTSSGSLVLGLAASHNHQPIQQIFEAAFLDDLWQQQKWGYDADADQRLKYHQTLLENAYRYLEMLSQSPRGEI